MMDGDRFASAATPGHPGDDLHPGTLKRLRKNAIWPPMNADERRSDKAKFIVFGVSEASPPNGETMKKYAIVIEQGENNLSAYVPDLPGCITSGRTVDEIERNVREAIELHLEGLQEVG